MEIRLKVNHYISLQIKGGIHEFKRNVKINMMKGSSHSNPDHFVLMINQIELLTH